MIVLPFPDKALWPNGRAHWATKSRAFAKHKAWAFNATKAKLPRCFKWNGEPIKLRYVITPKTAQDGIALALGIDDSAFAVPMIEFAEPRKPGGVEVGL
jgi:crossover junction endodeoxyribonuclease RusA